MIYAIVILIVIFAFIASWIYDLTGDLKRAKRTIEDRREMIVIVEKECLELRKDIRALVDGGLCEQEAVQMKYKKKYDQEKQNQKLIQASWLDYQQRTSGLQGLGGIPGLYQPRF